MKCIITKLSETVDNENLEKFGIISCGMPLNGRILNSLYGMMGRYPSIYVTAKEGLHFADAGGLTYTQINGNNVEDPRAVLDNTSVPGKAEWDYYKSEAIAAAFNIEEVVSDSIIAIDAIRYEPSGSGVNKPGINTAYGSMTGIAQRVPNLLYFRCEYMSASGAVSGTIMDLVDLPLIKYISVRGQSFITGDVKDFADAQVAAGRTSGTVTVRSNSLLTNNGTVLGEGTTVTITYSNGSYTIA